MVSVDQLWLWSVGSGTGMCIAHHVIIIIIIIIETYCFNPSIPMGVMANLEQLWLESNQIGDTGMQSFSTAIASWALPSLRSMYLDGNLGNDAPAEKALAKRKK